MQIDSYRELKHIFASTIFKLHHYFHLVKQKQNLPKTVEKINTCNHYTCC